MENNASIRQGAEGFKIIPLISVEHKISRKTFMYYPGVLLPESGSVAIALRIFSDLLKQLQKRENWTLAWTLFLNIILEYYSWTLISDLRPSQASQKAEADPLPKSIRTSPPLFPATIPKTAM